MILIVSVIIIIAVDYASLLFQFLRTISSHLSL